MQKFNTDLRQTIKWLHNKAPNIQSIINSKAEWYEKYNDRFWTNWEHDVFNLDTVNEFGVYVWCEILGIPKSKFVFEPLTNAWAYGKERQNYKYSGVGESVNIPAADRNIIGGNFFGAGDDVIASLVEARIILKLRYATLISDGRIPSINYMLKYIISKESDWDYPNNKYFYVTDASSNAIITDTILDFRIQDWQGDWQAKTTPRTQIGQNNVSMAPGTLTTNKWQTGFSIGTAATQGQTEAVLAPDGSMNAWKTTFPATFSNPAAQYSPRGVTTSDATKILPDGPRQVYVQSFFFKPDRSAAGFKKVMINGAIAKVSNLDPANYWFINQDAIFDFTNGDPVMTVRPAGGGAVTYNTDARYSGWEKYPNDWYRIWTVSITSNTHPTVSFNGEIKNQLHFGLIGSPFETLAGKIFTTWGAMVEKRADDGSIPRPGVFFYTANNRNSQKSQIDYVIDLMANNVTMAASDAGGSILLSGAKLVAAGEWKGFEIGTPYVMATGDGNTRAFPLVQPPGHQQPYNTPARMEYRIGRGFTFSPQFINLISDRSLGILPANAGIPYDVVY